MVHTGGINKPGQSANLDVAYRTAAQGLEDVASIGSGSHNDRGSAQREGNSNRMAQRKGPAGPSGKAEVERDEVLENQTSNYTASTRTNFDNRKKLFRS